MNDNECGLRRLLVTGAGGFVGGRVTELAHLNKFAIVRAGLRRWDTAARVARFGVDIGLCDVLNRQQLIRNIKGMDAVVHCAAGQREVITQGTDNALNAAYKLGTKRFVYISTAEVYGDVAGEIDEEYTFRSMRDEYADAKIEAEKLCREYSSKGLPVVILRPSLVYGPFGNQYVVRIAERLFSGGVGDMESTANGFCNLVYVDDLVNSVFLSITKNDAIGQAFNINGPDKITWNEYFKELAAALCIPQIKHLTETKAKAKSAVLSLVAPAASFVGQHYGGFVLRAANWLEIRREIENLRSFLRTTPTNYEMKLMSRKTHYSYEKAVRMLGYSPRYDVRAGLRLTAKWFSHEGHLQRLDPRLQL